MANQTGDRGFNTVHNSNVDKRERNRALQKYTLLGVIALAALTVFMLLVMAIGGIIANIRGEAGHGPDNEKVDWGSFTVTATDTLRGPLALVNTTHKYTFPDGLDHLGAINDKRMTHTPRVYQQSGLSTYMEITALDALDQMLVDFHAATGLDNVLLKYAYRSAEEQQACKGRVDALQATLSAMPAVDARAVAEQAEALAAQERGVSEGLKAVHIRLAGNRRAQEEIKAARVHLSREEARLSWLSELARTAGGRLEGKEKIMLEAWVQMAYFERILHHANRRMKAMSRGQYELVRQVDAENRRSQTGLELSVRDWANDTVRSARSLSGGEAFLASLSLALGMSDEIQAQQGGIELDTLFVDEGFGSLDEELLRVAIATLQRLSEDRRLVGVISHVGEMREKISKKIVVRKGSDGASHAHLEA